MTTRMLIDARHQEETRVAVVKGNKIEEFDFESSEHKQLKGNIYLAKVTRVEPSLQAAFVDYGGNRHGFLAFSEIHPDYYQIPKRRPRTACSPRKRSMPPKKRPCALKRKRKKMHRQTWCAAKRPKSSIPHWSKLRKTKASIQLMSPKAEVPAEDVNGHDSDDDEDGDEDGSDEGRR